MNPLPKILIADDEPGFLAMYQKFVEKAGFDVLLAHDGEEALKLAFDERPAVVVLDVDMAKKDGLEVMKEFVKTNWAKNLPIIILTGK